MTATTTQEKFQLNTTEDFQFDNWDDFAQHLTFRKNPIAIGDVFGGKKRAICWGMPHRDGSDAQKLINRIAKLMDVDTKPKRQDSACLNWLKEISADTGPSVDSALVAVGLAGVLPKLVGVSDKDDWCLSFQQLLHIAGSSAEHRNSLVRQLLSVELPLVLSFQFPEVVECVELGEAGFESLFVEQEELLDSDGAIDARYCDMLPTFLGTWTRSFLLAEKLGFEFDEPGEQKWEWFVRYAMRLLRADGTSMLSNPAIEYSLDLYKAAVKTSTDKEERVISRLVLPGGNRKNRKTELLSQQGTFSEWAGLGVLQQDWSPESPRLAVACKNESIRVEVCRGNKLFEMTGLPDVSINGKSLTAIDEWEEVCSHFDDDIDFIELEIDLEDDVRLQRQLCLIHDDDVIIIADAVFSKSPERIDYQNRLALPESISPMQETENTEIYLRKSEIRSLVLPMNLSEWQSSARDDKFACSDEAITLWQSVLGKSLYAPVFVELNPGNSVKPRTWNKLTVAESLEIVSDDVARAYRVRIGEQQWVLYKTFERAGNRSFFGQNHTCDLFIGRFQDDGNVEELLSLEP